MVRSILQWPSAADRRGWRIDLQRIVQRTIYSFIDLRQWGPRKPSGVLPPNRVSRSLSHPLWIPPRHPWFAPVSWPPSRRRSPPRAIRTSQHHVFPIPSRQILFWLDHAAIDPMHIMNMRKDMGIYMKSNPVNAEPVPWPINNKTRLAAEHRGDRRISS